MGSDYLMRKYHLEQIFWRLPAIVIYFQIPWLSKSFLNFPGQPQNSLTYTWPEKKIHFPDIFPWPWQPCYLLLIVSNFGTNQLMQLCTAPTVLGFDIGHCTVIHCDARGVSLVDQWKAEKNRYSFNWPITTWFLKLIKVGLITEHLTKIGLINQVVQSPVRKISLYLFRHNYSHPSCQVMMSKYF